MCLDSAYRLGMDLAFKRHRILDDSGFCRQPVEAALSKNVWCL